VINWSSLLYSSYQAIKRNNNIHQNSLNTTENLNTTQTFL